MSFSGFSRTVLSAAVAIVVAAPALAQNTTAAVGGRVTGTDGKPVAGASVSIVHTESGTTSTIFSDADGRYTARGLRVGGPYTISVNKDGKIEKIEGVFLQLAEAGSVDVKLGSAAAALSTVVVTGSSASAVFDSGNRGAGTQLGRKEIDAYASVQRNLQDYARLDPRLSQTDKDRGEISALGQNSRFNSITIDGVSINDSFGLESNNLPTAKQPISIDAIQSVQVNIANFDVTQKGYTGANINAVTKSGTNDVKGSVYYVYRDNKTTGDRYNRPADSYSAVADFKESTKGITVGGPLIKDKLFFFASVEDQRSSRATPAFGPVGSSLTNVGITNAQIAAVAAIAKARYNIDIGGLDVPSGTELTSKDYTLKFDWNINDQHRANLRISKIEQFEPIFYGFGTRALSYRSHWTTEKKTLETQVAQWFADWSPTFSTELKLSKRENPKSFENNSVLPQVSLIFTAPAPAGTTSGDRTLRFGTEEFRHLNELRTSTTDMYFAGNWALGRHEVKAGVDFTSNDIYNAFLSGTNGVYAFRGADPVALLNAGRPTSYSVQVAQPGATLNDGIANWNLKNLGLFVQDTVSVTDRLNINAGVRLDRASTSDRPKANPAAQSAFGYDNTVTIDGQTLVQPRFGFNYEMEADEKRKSQIRGGLGLFQGGAANVWLSNPFSNPGVATRTFACTNAQASSQCPTDLVFSPDTKNQPVLSGAIPAAAVDIISPDLKQPSVWKMNLALDKELPWYGLVVGAEWIHTRTNSGINYRHLNLGSATAISPDGRELYYNAGGRSENCWTGDFSIRSGCGNARANRNTQFTDVVLAEAGSSGGGNALTLSLASPGRGGLGWMVAYTRTDATDVNPLTSSRAISNWGGRSVLNPNEDTTGPSNYLVKDRFTGALNWSKAFVANYKTSFGLVYEGRTGKPYSWTFNNDLNGDGLAGNDLLYIPKAPGSGEVLFYGATVAAQKANEDKFWAIVDAESSLNGVRGGVVGRNNATAKFTNNFDLRVSQELPGFFGKHKGSIALDILNVGNLLNKEWGRIDEVSFQSAGGLARSFVNYAGIKDGKYIYNVQPLEDFVTRNSKNESQWAAQITLKYEF